MDSIGTGSVFFFIIILVFAWAIALGSFNQTPEDLGRSGEQALERRLKSLIREGRCSGEILMNIYVPTGDGRTIEIDLLFVSAKGLFVIESKRYSGYIFGNEKHRNWTETLYAGRRGVERHHFYCFGCFDGFCISPPAVVESNYTKFLTERRAPNVPTDSANHEKRIEPKFLESF